MPTGARSGFGSKFKRDDGTGTFVEIAECLDFDGPNVSQITLDATNQDSPGWGEKIVAGIREVGDITFQMHVLQGSTSQNLLWADLGSTTARAYRLYHPNGVNYIGFSGFVTAIGRTQPVKDKMMFSVTVSVTGALTVV